MLFVSTNAMLVTHHSFFFSSVTSSNLGPLKPGSLVVPTLSKFCFLPTAISFPIPITNVITLVAHSPKTIVLTLPSQSVITCDKYTSWGLRKRDDILHPSRERTNRQPKDRLLAKPPLHNTFCPCRPNPESNSRDTSKLGLMAFNFGIEGLELLELFIVLTIQTSPFGEFILA